MPETYTIGIDVGTYETKGVLVNTHGDILATSTRGHNLRIPKAGWAEHDAEQDWWHDTRDILQELLTTTDIPAEHIKAIGLSAIGPCVVPVDQEGHALRPAILYGIDTRATDEITELTTRHTQPTLLQRCGNALTTQSIGPKILWLKHHEPHTYRAAHRFFTSTSYLVHKLTGESVIDHYTAASFTPLYDIHTQTWAPDLANGIVELERLGNIKWTCDPAGRVTREASAETGLAEGTLVITGTVDAAAEAVSAGVTAPGDMMLMYGTTLFMIEVLASRKQDARLWSAPFLFPGTHALMAGMATTGALTRWARDQFARELIMEERTSGTNAYAVLAEEAQSVPAGSDGLVVLPYFSGERTPIQDPNAKGVVFGLTLAHTRAHLYRAILESVGYGIRHHLDVLHDLQVLPERLVAVGGGTKNPLWLQAVSDITGRPQEVPKVTIGASYGDAFLASCALHPEREPQAIHDWISVERTIMPQAEHQATYDRSYRIYRDLYGRTRDLMRH